jgi:hypothetical protein
MAPCANPLPENENPLFVTDAVFSVPCVPKTTFASKEAAFAYLRAYFRDEVEAREDALYDLEIAKKKRKATGDVRGVKAIDASIQKCKTYAMTAFVSFDETSKAVHSTFRVPHNLRLKPRQRNQVDCLRRDMHDMINKILRLTLKSNVRKMYGDGLRRSLIPLNGVFGPGTFVECDEESFYYLTLDMMGYLWSVLHHNAVLRSGKAHVFEFRSYNEWFPKHIKHGVNVRQPNPNLFTVAYIACLREELTATKRSRITYADYEAYASKN